MHLLARTSPEPAGRPGAQRPERGPVLRSAPHGRVERLLVAPAVIGLVVAVVIPVVLVVALGFFSYDPLTGALEPVGTDNFLRLLTGSELLPAALHTLAYAAMTVLPIMLVGLLLALGINTVARGRGLLRTAYFLPVAATLAGMSVVWRWMFYPETGIIDSSIGRVLGVHDWLNSTSLALPAVAVVGCWQGVGSTMIMFLAALSGVPRALLEAATLDGAGPWHRFWTVTWPAIGPATVFALITTTRDSLRVFDQVAVMTQGDPHGASTTLAYLMWQRGIGFSDLGGASVVNVVLLALVLLTIVAQVRVVGRRWELAGAR
ncbi:carbohydrate ABC transporter permease [Spongiactinospora sp. 9N601]|uniref:carbohydrate ABC transporter permease n=1 Tax=Spongiactinospora sp. 9N601 TaxID=3375149 RepID=UPI00379AEBF6